LFQRSKAKVPVDAQAELVVTGLCGRNAGHVARCAALVIAVVQDVGIERDVCRQQCLDTSARDKRRLAMPPFLAHHDIGGHQRCKELLRQGRRSTAGRGSTERRGQRIPEPRLDAVGQPVAEVGRHAYRGLRIERHIGVEVGKDGRVPLAVPELIADLAADPEAVLRQSGKAGADDIEVAAAFAMFAPTKKPVQLVTVQGVDRV